jgi:hypothetical protein
MKITFSALTILVFSFFLAPHYSEGNNSKNPSEQRQESIIIAANESSDPPFILNEVSGWVGVQESESFGSSVAIFEDLAVVGAHLFDFGSQTDRGRALVFRRISGSSGWEFLKTLLADDGEASDHFGFSVATNGDFIIVGAPDANVNEFINSGSAYMFYRNQGGTDNWGQVAKLTPNDPESYAYFGASVALGYGVQFKTALVGASGKDGTATASGAAYIFNEGIQIKKLTAPDARAEAYFGDSVAYTDNWFHWIVVGAPGDFNGSEKQTGSAYLFERDWGSPNSWGFNIKITPSDGDDDDFFGDSVAISGDTVVIGAPHALTNKGAAYVFKPFWVSWEQAKKLMPTDGENYGFFGYAVAVEGDVVAVGAPSYNPGWGCAFKRNEGGTDNWGQYARLAARNGDVGDYLGNSIDISGSTVIAGAPYCGSYGTAYFFDLPAVQTTIKAMPWIPLILLDE